MSNKTNQVEDTINLHEISRKWQVAWQKAKIFEARVEKKKKFFVNAPYPYINGFLHLGHLYTYMRTEAFARYKRAQGFNVLYPQGWHATGSPIINAAKRIVEHEPKQIQIMKDMNFSDTEIKKFADPKYWIKFFPPESRKDLQSLGLSIDWTREFFTTELNAHYDKFVRWQFKKLKEKGFVIKGKFPVVWCQKDNTIVQDHSRIEGEGETPQEFCLVKHKIDKNKFVVTATLRQDTILGITNLYIDPDAEYLEIEILNSGYGKSKGEIWVVGKPIIKKLREQNFNIKEFEKVKGKELVGKKVEVFGGRKVLILPASFLDPEFGTGIVHSVPSDSADDLIALYDLQKDEATIKKFGLNLSEVKSIKPIGVLNTPGYGDVPAEVFLKKYNIKSQHEKEKLDKITKELYKTSYYSATFNHLYKNAFSKNLEGVSVQKGKEFIKQELLKKNAINIYYQLTGKVVCRCLTPSIVKIVSDQWFIDYGNEKWKKLTHKCLGQMKLYPEKSRQQFQYVIDWLKAWACTHEEGLGTRLPWDEKWLIESLSDSTIYMAYYTIAHLIKEIPIEKVNDEFFDYIFLGKGKNPTIKDVEKMREEFEYWYPVDFRNSGKDLIQNHLTFFLFNHVAIFPEKYWPRGIGTNGWTIVDGQKMSKSLGNFIIIREAIEKYGADVSRLTMLNGGEDLDDPNWDSRFAESIQGKLKNFFELLENYRKGKDGKLSKIDEWMENKLAWHVSDATKFMEQTLFRSTIQKIYFDLVSDFRWYLRRVEKPNKKVLQKVLESFIIMMQPFTPHIAEELWQKIGKKTFVSLEKWPELKEKKFVDTEEQIKKLLSDIRNLVQIIKKKPSKAFVYTVPNEASFYLEASDFLSHELEIQVKVFSSNDKKIYDPLKKAVKAQTGRPSVYLE